MGKSTKINLSVEIIGKKVTQPWRNVFCNLEENKKE